MRRSNSRRRYDDATLSLVKESIRSSSMSRLLIEAEGSSPTVPENEQVKYRAVSVKALEQMAGTMNGAGFATTAAAMLKGAALLKRNINVDEEEDEKTASLFALVPVLMSSLLSLLSSITTQASELNVQYAGTLEAIFSDEEGNLDNSQLEKLISKNFKPSPGFMKWLKSSKLGRAVTSGVDWFSKEFAAMEGSRRLLDRDLLSDDLFSSNFDMTLQEGLGDFLGKLLKSLWSSTAATSKTTVQSLAPLLGSVGIHKLLMRDMTGKSKEITFSRVKIALEALDKIRRAFAVGSPRPVSSPAAPSNAADNVSQEQTSQAVSVPNPVKASPEVVEKVASALERVNADPAVVDATRQAMSGDKEGLSAAYEELNRQQREFISILLKQLSGGSAAAPALRAAVADAPAAGVVEPAEDLEYIKDLPASVYFLIQKHGGGKAPGVIDRKIKNSEPLRRTLDLAGRLRKGDTLSESGKWVKFLFEENGDQSEVDPKKAFTIAGVADGLDSNEEITGPEAEEIVTAITAGAKDRKKAKGFDELQKDLKDKSKELGEKINELAKEKQTVFANSELFAKFARFAGITDVNDLLKIVDEDGGGVSVKIGEERYNVNSIADLVNLANDKIDSANFDIYDKREAITWLHDQIGELTKQTTRLATEVEGEKKKVHSLREILKNERATIAKLNAKIDSAVADNNELKRALEREGLKKEDFAKLAKETFEKIVEDESFSNEKEEELIRFSIGELDRIEIGGKTYERKDIMFLIHDLLLKSERRSQIAKSFIEVMEPFDKGHLSLKSQDESVNHLSPSFGSRSFRNRKTTTTRHSNNDSLIIERWQRLAGIIK